MTLFGQLRGAFLVFLVQETTLKVEARTARDIYLFIFCERDLVFLACS